MSSVYFDPAVGGDGSTVTDDSNATTGLGSGGHRTRFVPSLSNIVSIGAVAVAKAAAASLSAASALAAPGTNATSTTSLAIVTGSAGLTIQTGKSLVVGMTVKIASTASPGNWMAGDITAYNSGTGSLTVNVISTLGSGTFAAWTVSVSGAMAGDPLMKSGGTMTGPIVLSADPAAAMQPATKQYADAKLPLTGGTLTGLLTLSTNPTANLDAATKQYADSIAFPAGTKLLFAQTAAPTGWTKDTTHNDKALRVVSGTAGSGGSAAFTTVFASKTPAGTITVDPTTLTEAQIPSHNHIVSAYFYTQVQSGGGGLGNTPGTTNTSSTGGGGSHIHSGSFSGTAMDFAVQYVDVIIATKN